MNLKRFQEYISKSTHIEIMSNVNKTHKVLKIKTNRIPFEVDGLKLNENDVISIEERNGRFSFKNDKYDLDFRFVYNNIIQIPKLTSSKRILYEGIKYNFFDGKPYSNRLGKSATYGHIIKRISINKPPIGDRTPKEYIIMQIKLQEYNRSVEERNLILSDEVLELLYKRKG